MRKGAKELSRWQHDCRHRAGSQPVPGAALSALRSSFQDKATCGRQRV